jgi:hypothetical protein
MKKKRLVLYGEKTVLLKTRRVPESKKDELEKMIDDFLMKCVKPGYVESENYLADESTTFPSKSKEDHWEAKKSKKPPKKIEPQVVEEELDEYEDFIEKLPSLPFKCKVTGHNEKGHDIYTDIEKKFFYVKEKEGDRYIAVKFENIVQAISYVREYMVEKKK